MTDDQHFTPVQLPDGGQIGTREGGKLLETDNGEPIGVTPSRRETYHVDQDGFVATGFLEHGDHDDDQ